MPQPTKEAPHPGRPRHPRLNAAMVQATLELLTERGYNDLSLAAVADRAGTTTTALYRRWGSKAALVMDAVLRTDGDDVVAESGDISADLARMIRWSVEKICRPVALAAVVGMLGESLDERSSRATTAAMASSGWRNGSSGRSRPGNGAPTPTPRSLDR